MSNDEKDDEESFWKKLTRWLYIADVSINVVNHIYGIYSTYKRNEQSKRIRQNQTPRVIVSNDGSSCRSGRGVSSGMIITEDIIIDGNTQILGSIESQPPSDDWRVPMEGEDIEAQEDEDDKNVCKICFENMVQTVILDCGHTILCLRCARRYNEMNEEQRRCPVCNQEMNQIKRTFN